MVVLGKGMNIEKIIWRTHPVRQTVPKNNLHLRIKNRAYHGWSKCNGICLADMCTQKPDIFYASAPALESVFLLLRF